VGQALHVVPTGATEYWPAVQFVHVRSIVVVQAAALFLVPAGHTVHGIHAIEPVVDLKEPGAHATHVPEPEKDAE
jgi:hypothetical protein